MILRGAGKSINVDTTGNKSGEERFEPLTGQDSSMARGKVKALTQSVVYRVLHVVFSPG